MGIRRRIFELINGKLPSWNNAQTRYQGMVHVLDSDLAGNLRFAKALGHPFPVWVADTSIPSPIDIKPTMTYIDVPRWDWVIPGARLRFDSRWDVTVSDVSQNGATTRIFFQEPIDLAFPAGTEITLFSVPIHVSGSYAGPTTVFVIHSPTYDVYTGDVLLFNTLSGIEIQSLFFVGINPEGEKVYEVTLSEPYDGVLEDTQTLYLQAFPAYESPKMLTPKQPWVWDRVSSVFYEDQGDVREVDYVSTYNATTDLMISQVAPKNTSIYRSSLPVDALLFGVRRAGVVKWDSSKSAVVLFPGETGFAHLSYDFTPSWLPGQVTSWSFTVECEVATDVVITLAPGPKVLAHAPAGSSSITVPMPSVPVTSLEIKVFAPEGSEIRIRDIGLSSQEAVAMVSHTTVAHVQGSWSWGSTGALSKRALRLSDVIARTDLNGTLTAGFYAG